MILVTVGKRWAHGTNITVRYFRSIASVEAGQMDCHSAKNTSQKSGWGSLILVSPIPRKRAAMHLTSRSLKNLNTRGSARVSYTRVLSGPRACLLWVYVCVGVGFLVGLSMSTTCMYVGGPTVALGLRITIETNGNLLRVIFCLPRKLNVEPDNILAWQKRTSINSSSSHETQNSSWSFGGSAPA